MSSDYFVAFIQKPCALGSSTSRLCKQHKGVLIHQAADNIKPSGNLILKTFQNLGHFKLITSTPSLILIVRREEVLSSRLLDDLIPKCDIKIQFFFCDMYQLVAAAEGSCAAVRFLVGTWTVMEKEDGDMANICCVVAKGARTRINHSKLSHIMSPQEAVITPRGYRCSTWDCLIFFVFDPDCDSSGCVYRSVHLSSHSLMAGVLKTGTQPGWSFPRLQFEPSRLNAWLVSGFEGGPVDGIWRMCLAQQWVISFTPPLVFSYLFVCACEGETSSARARERVERQGWRREKGRASVRWMQIAGP